MLSNRKKFTSQLEDLNNKILDMGAEVVDAFKNIISACESGDLYIAKYIVENDKVINDIEISINVDGYLLIARQCPVASDLRRIITALKISNDLERIADYAVNIAKYMLKTKHDNKVVVDSIIFLGKHLISMLEGIMESFANEDIELALKVSDLDEILDDVYKDEVKKLSSVKVSAIMNSKVVTASPETSLKDLAVLFAEKRVNPIPVTDKENRLLGIVSRSDIVRLFAGLNI